MKTVYTYGVGCTYDYQCDDSIGLICAYSKQACLCTQFYYWNSATSTCSKEKFSKYLEDCKYICSC